LIVDDALEGSPSAPKPEYGMGHGGPSALPGSGPDGRSGGQSPRERVSPARVPGRAASM
jgi:hypothetical protein